MSQRVQVGVNELAPVWQKLAQVVLVLFMLRFVWSIAKISFSALDAAALDSASSSLPQGKNPVLERVEQPGGVLVSVSKLGNQRGSSYPFRGDLVRIGRVEGNDVIIDDRYVSSQHARLVWRDGQYFLEDVHSTNHTYVNGMEIREAYPLRDDDVITLGEISFRFSYQPSNSSSAAH